MMNSSSSRRFPSLFLLLVCLVFGAAGALRADTINFPADGSGINLTLPEGWKTSHADDGGLKCTATDGRFSFILMPAKRISDLKSALPFLVGKMIEGASLTQLSEPEDHEYTTAGGVRGETRRLTGKNGARTFFVTAVGFTPPKGDKCLLLCVVPVVLMEANSRAFEGIVSSIKPAGAGAAGSASAEDTVKFPSDGSGVVFTLPSDWMHTVTESGDLKCTSGDRQFSFMLMPAQSIIDMKKTVEYLAKKMIEKYGLTAVDRPDDKQRTDRTGLKWTIYAVQAKKDADRFEVFAFGLTPPSGDNLMLLGMARMDVMDAQESAFRKITDSFTPAR